MPECTFRFAKLIPSASTPVFWAVPTTPTVGKGLLIISFTPLLKWCSPSRDDVREDSLLRLSGSSSYSSSSYSSSSYSSSSAPTCKLLKNKFKKG